MSKIEKAIQHHTKQNTANPTQRALSRWDGEGGAGPDGAQKRGPKEKFIESENKKNKKSAKSTVKKVPKSKL